MVQDNEKSNTEVHLKYFSSEFLISFVLSFLFWLSILSYAGTLTSGFHFTDDHEIIQINYEIHQDDNIITTITRWVRADFQGRLRTFYYIHRIIETSIFHTDFFAWSIYTLLLASFTSTLLYLFGRHIQFSALEASLFVLFTLLGSQSSIWWRLGPAEAIAMFTFSLSLVLHGFASSRQNKSLWIESFAFITSLLAAASKESFILMMPPLALLRIWVTDKKFQIGWKQALRKNISAILMLAVLFCVGIYLVFHIGTEKMGYAGISGFTFSRFLKTISEIIIVNNVKRYIAIVCIAAILIPSSSKDELIENIKTFFKRHYMEILILSSIVIPQAFLYTKSGIEARYLLPAMLGCAFFLTVIIQSLRQTTKFSYQTQVLTLLVLAYAAFIALRYSVIREASNFAAEGYETRSFLTRVVNETDKESKIVVVADPAFHYEQTLSLVQYLTISASRPNLQVETIQSKKDDDYYPFQKWLRSQFREYLKEYSVHENSSVIPDASCLILYPESERLMSGSINRSVYNRWDFDLAVVYCKTK
jgi:hypothetical protein